MHSLGTHIYFFSLIETAFITALPLHVAQEEDGRSKIIQEKSASTTAC